MKFKDLQTSLILGNLQGALKLKHIFLQGFLPNRGLSSYNNKTIFLTNCFGHACMNLPDNLLSRFKPEERYVFKLSSYGKINNTKNLKKTFLKAMKCYNLKVKTCSQQDVPDENSWKIVFFKNTYVEDYHFFKYETQKVISHKLGFTDDRELSINVPHYKNLELIGYYMITNPNAKQLSDTEMKSLEEELETM